MATVVQSILEPNRDAIKAHLQALFRPVQEEYPDGLIEIAHGPVKPDRASHFAVTDRGIEEAAAFAFNRTSEGQNVYVGVNPRKRTTKWNVRSEDDDVEIAFWHFADLDTEEAVVAARQELSLKPCMIVMTGTVPHNRPHLYWKLDEATQNLEAWSERQRGIAQCLKGDSVINSSRIMRLAGTINYPPQHKLQRGYDVERVGLRDTFKDERPPVTPDEIRVAFPVRHNEAPAPGPAATGNTLKDMAQRHGLDVEQALANCRNDHNWRDNARSLTSHWAAVGWSNVEILAMAEHITLPGYTVDQTRRELFDLTRTARTKYSYPDPQPAILADPEGSEDLFPFLRLSQIEDLPPPTWLVHELIPENGLTIIYGDPGAGKSFITLDMALRSAYGMDWHGIATKQVGVLYIAGEGRHGLGKRITGWRKEHAMEGVEAPFVLQPVAAHLLDKDHRAKLIRTIEAIIAEISFPIGLIIIDTVSRSIAGQDENKQESMSLFVDACAALQNFTNGAVIGVHHSGKDKDRGMRGSTVLLGGCDASLRLTKDEQTVKLEIEKQKDAEEIAPIYLNMKKVEWAIGLGNAENTLVPEKTGKPSIDSKQLSRRQADMIFDEVDAAWLDENPWSVFPQSKRKGRYLIDYMAEEFGISKRSAEDYTTKWQSRGYMKSEPASGNRASGLRVIKRLEQET